MFKGFLKALRIKEKKQPKTFKNVKKKIKNVSKIK